MNVRSMLLWGALCFSSTNLSAAEPMEIRLWEGQAPGEDKPLAAAETNAPARENEQPPVIRRTQVSIPTLTVYPAPKDKANGTSVVIAPGGGYSILAWNLEGTEVAEWLNSQGVTAFVLKYRVPKRMNDPENKLPLMDAQRAIRVVRSRAAEWQLNPDRIGMLGFSAGGNLTAKTATQYRTLATPASDDIDQLSPRPNFAILIYPAWLADKKDSTKLAADFPVDDQTPPMFLVHASDDKLVPDNSIVMFQALRAAKVPAELHVYVSGGHGFGLRPSQHAVSQWPARAADWLRHQKLITSEH